MSNVLVYGSLRKDFYNHRLLKGSKFLGETEIKGTLFNLGPYPALSLKGDYNIRCEGYDVSPDTLKNLDRLEGHPSYYKREEVDSDFGKAYVYTMDHDKKLGLNHVIMSGDWSRK